MQYSYVGSPGSGTAMLVVGLLVLAEWRAPNGSVRACKLLKFVSMVSMFLTISGGKQHVFGPIILIINRN